MLRSSLTYRLNATILVIVLSMTSLMVMASSYYLYKRTIEDLKSDVSQTALLAELSLIDRLWDFDNVGAADIARSLLLDKSFAVVKILDKTGQIQITYTGLGFDNVSLDSFAEEEFFKVSRVISKGHDDIGSLDVLVSTRMARQKILNNTLMFFFASLLLSIILMGSMAWATDRLIKRPIFKLRRETDEVIHGNLLSPIDLTRNDELGALARDFAQMRDSIREKIAIIEQQNLSLEAKVEERTFQLEQKNKELSAVFSSLQEGILTFSNTKTFDPEHSPYVLEIFRIAGIEGMGPKDLLFPDAEGLSDSAAQCLSALDAILDSPEVNYDLNKFLLPRDHHVTVNKEARILDLSWSPVISDEGVTEKMVLCIRDVTEIQAVRAMARSNQETVKSLQELMNCEAGTYNRFFDALPERISNIRELLQMNTADSIRDAIRSLHTIKGNSRTFGFAALSDKTHEMEESLKTALKGALVLSDNQSFMPHINRLHEIYQQYQDVRFKIIKISQGEIKAAFGDLVDELLQELEGRESTVALEFKSRLHAVFRNQELRTTLEALGRSALPKIAKDCLKPTPELNIYGGNIILNPNSVTMLNDVLIHLFRNSMDHGIESALDRARLGKNQVGQIDIFIHEMKEQLEIIYQDDGNGLDLDRIREVMKGRNLLQGDAAPTRDLLEEVLFRDGFSTAEKVTVVSGRGVGMSAVRAMIKDHSGSIRCDILKEDSLAGGVAKLRWVIRLPLQNVAQNLLSA